MQILPGVYRINGSPYGRHQNGYLIHRDGATVLIGSGDLEDAETLPGHGPAAIGCRMVVEEAYSEALRLWR